MMRYVLLIFIYCLSLVAYAESEETIALAHAPVNSSDIESIKRGAKFFAANCMSCHTLVYLRYDKLAASQGITYSKMPINVKEWPFAVRPPDLSSEADIRGVDWIYTYLHSFYLDEKRPTGVNNLLVPNTSMSNIIGPFQGEQVLDTAHLQKGILTGKMEWFDVLRLRKAGSMTPDQFDATILDIVNFLNYAAAPYQVEQHKIGYWVLGFLVLLFILMYILKKEYWKDVKKNKN